MKRVVVQKMMLPGETLRQAAERHAIEAFIKISEDPENPLRYKALNAIQYLKSKHSAQ